MGLFLWTALFVFRILNGLLIKTYFDPDEYWQSIEVAHQYVFGYGYLTWEWRVGLRSWLTVLPYILMFKTLKAFNLDSNNTLFINAPKVFAALIAASIDYFTYLLAQKFYKDKSLARHALIFSLFNWFAIAYYPRMLSNNLETLLTAIAAYFWPSKDLKRYSLALLFVGLAVLARPSAISHWLFPAILLFISSKSRVKILSLSISLAMLIIVFGALVDRLFYGRWVLPWLNFLRINFIDNVSIFYGRSSWHFHLTQSLPLLALTMLPLIMVALWHKQANPWTLQFLAGSLFLNSLFAHKEWRFLLPLLPFLLITAAKGYKLLKLSSFTRSLFLAFIVFSNLSLGFYAIQRHQRGVIDVIDYLRTSFDNGRVSGILFSMPCHSTPFYGYLHRTVPMDFVTCEPPLDSREQFVAGQYLDESDLFYANPSTALRTRLLQKKYSHLVFFEVFLDPDVKIVLSELGYSQTASFFNADVAVDHRRAGKVLLYYNKIAK